jgi:peptide-methionine (S)-S-oxide reductase
MKLTTGVVATTIFLTPIVSAFLLPQTIAPCRRRHSHDDSTVALSAMQQATFGMGCFWKPSEELLKVDGVVNTIVGYTGHPDPAVAAPNYESVCYGRSWVEGVRVEYDDAIISYDMLLDAFFAKQEPKTGSRQYASIIFTHDDEQRKTAVAWSETNQNRIRADGVPALFTKIEPLSAFFKAEDYHQNYWQKTRPRFGAMLVLTAIASGLIDQWTPIDYISPLHTTCNTLVLAGLLFVTLERKIQSKTVPI